LETIPLDTDQGGSYEALLAFMQACQLKALASGRPQLASIAADASQLDPLAVLESIYEREQPHFYVERRREDFALAGAEVALGYEADGGERFESVKRWMQDALENCIAVGDESLPFFGPTFFCGFSFDEAVSPDAPFGGTTVFVPRWQVASTQGRCVAVANALVEPEGNVEEISRRIWNANAKFRSFEYEHDEGAEKTGGLSILNESEGAEKGAFVQSVEKALDLVDEGTLQKIVLARALDLQADRNFNPLEILNTLRERYEDCYAFSLANARGKSFIGASPERLVSTDKGRISIDVLAGTAPRGRTASEDAALGSTLLSSEKDLREHRIVYDSICRRLQSLGIKAGQAWKPRLKRLQNVQHLLVELAADLPEGAHILDLVKELHPTPAVGGTPREQAVPRIRDLEHFDRGLYAAPLGWIRADGDGEFLVGIRSALVDADRARLYAGVGVVEGSCPEKEFGETELKFKALKENLL